MSMQTKQLYLTDSYAKEMDASVLEVKPEGNGTWRVLLDQTVFYPMGGGQPTDQGTLSDGINSLGVYMVMMKEGELWHYIKSQTGPVVGTNLHGTINWDRRYKNMRNHSAGHIVDFAMHTLGYSPQKLIPSKGDHGKKPYIMYQGVLTEDIKQKLENESNKLIEKNLAFTTLFQPFEELKKEALYLQPGLPANKPLRTLRLETVGVVADGGTQVATTKEVGKILITLIESKDNTVTIHYSLAS